VGGKGLNSMTPLHWVAAHGLLEEAKLLVSRGALIDAEVACMAKPIVFALDNKHYDMIDFLIKAGADKDYALLNAIRNNEVGVAKKLADAGANLMSKNEGNVTLLHFAAMAGATKSIKWLLDQGLDINAIDCTGGTPLFDAITKPSLEGVKILVEHGADLHIKNNKGETPIDLAKLEFVPKTITRFIQQHI
jgi:ankyrin repeat protein